MDSSIISSFMNVCACVLGSAIEIPRGTTEWLKIEVKLVNEEGNIFTFVSHSVLILKNSKTVVRMCDGYNSSYIYIYIMTRRPH